MIIGIDYSLATATNRGMGRYVREIVNCIKVIDNKNSYILYSQYPVKDSFPSNFSLHLLPKSNEVIAEQWHLCRQVKKDRIDVLWCPGNTFPLFLDSKIRLVVTIHDLIFFNSIIGKSNLRQKIGRSYRRLVLTYGHSRIDSVLTVSEYSKQEIAEKLKIKDIKITYNCIDTFFNLSKATILEKDRKDYYFTVSGDAPSKNLQFLLDVFLKHLPNEKIIIAGVPDMSHLRKYQCDNIIFLKSGISDEELIHHYKLCKAFIFPSIYEGFGIPVLEALVCDANIICSNRTSLPEIVGDFGIMIDPTNTISILNAISRIPFDIDQKAKDNHIKQFLKWENSAITVLNEFI